MSTAVVERESAVPAVTSDQLELIKRTVASGATADELKLYLYDCQRQGVHPLDKLIHFTKRSGKYTPITSIDFMRTRAADTGDYAGSDDAIFHDTVPDGGNFHASVTVWRFVQGQRCPFTATARWSEYKPEQNDFMWKKMPHTMLGKCAEALALRKGFPRQLAGLYAKEELDQAGNGNTHGVSIEAPAIDPATIPDGAVVLTAIKPGSGKILGFVVTHQGEELAIFQEGVLKQAEQLCQDATPVTMEIKAGKTSGKPYLVALHRVKDATAVLDAEVAPGGDLAF